MPNRHFSVFDKLVLEADRALRAVAGGQPALTRPTPAARVQQTEPLADTDKREAGRLMRVNHAGEVAAQALYQGQSTTARQNAIRDELHRAAAEEADHLAWCEDRLQALGTPVSRLNPLWYAGSFAIGAVAGLAGDRWNLGFLAETERQVVRHLDAHLQRLPAADAKSRAVLEQMKEDEARHGHTAEQAGGEPLPAPVRELMRLTSKVLTTTAYWI